MWSNRVKTGAFKRSDSRGMSDISKGSKTSQRVNNFLDRNFYNVAREKDQERKRSITKFIYEDINKRAAEAESYGWKSPRSRKAATMAESKEKPLLSARTKEMEPSREKKGPDVF